MNSSSSQRGVNHPRGIPDTGVTSYSLNGDLARLNGNTTRGSAAIRPRSLPFLEHPIKSQIAFGFLAAAILLVIVFGMLAGCSPDELNGAAAKSDVVRTQLVGSPTTQPNPGVTLVETVYPPATTWVTIAGVAVGAFALVSRKLAQWETSQVKANATVAFADIKDLASPSTWKNPTEPFTPRVEKFVADVAGLAAALPATT